MRAALAAPEANCSEDCIYKQVNPAECQKCELASAASAPDPWLEHLFMLFNLKETGCHFLLNDLTPEEWQGLVIIQQELVRINRPKNRLRDK